MIRYALPISFLMLACPPARPAAPNVVPLGSCAATLRAPSRLAVGPNGNIYVSDPVAGEVVIFDSWCRRVGNQSGFDRPLALAVDRQNRIYLAEVGSGRVSVFDSHWNLLHKLGTGDGEFALPGYITLAEGSSRTLVWISDSKRNKIKVFAGLNALLEFGETGAASGQFDFPAGLCLSQTGEVFVVDQNNDRVQVFDSAGQFLRAFPLGSASPSGRAQAILLDHAGRLYVSDTFQDFVKIFDAATGTALGTVSTFGQLPGQLCSPAGLALDPWNRLLVVSTGTGRVELYGIDSFLHTSLQPPSGQVAVGSALLLEAVAGPGATFQWQKNGVPIDGATSGLLALDQADVTNAGAYSVVVAGASGPVASSAVQVEVLSAPRITESPPDQKTLRGSTVVLQARATGSSLGYQWLHNDRELQGATETALVLPDVQLAQAGLYTLRVTNAVGSALSRPALLEVIVPPETMEIVSGTLASDGFHLLLNAAPGYRYILEAAVNLPAWIPLAELSLDRGLEEFVDPGATNWPGRFYRLHWVR